MLILTKNLFYIVIDINIYCWEIYHDRTFLLGCKLYMYTFLSTSLLCFAVLKLKLLQHPFKFDCQKVKRLKSYEHFYKILCVDKCVFSLLLNSLNEEKKRDTVWSAVMPVRCSPSATL